MKSRISLVALVWIALISPTAAQQNEQPPPVESSHITGQLHQLICNGNAGVVASIGKDGTLLVDTGFAGTAAAVQEELTRLGGGPARVIINTHGDADHVGGNAVLGEKAVIVAHPYVRQTMGRYFALAAVDTAGMPMVMVDEKTSIYFNGETIRVIPVPGGHTAGDVIVHFTGSKIACIGDLVLLGTFPNADPARGGDVRRLTKILNGIQKDLPADTKLLAAHGGIFTFDDLAAYIEMINATTAAIAAEEEKGHSLAEIVEKNPLTPWSQWERGANGLSYANWTREIFSSLTGESRRSICAPMTEALVADDVETAIATYHRLEKEEAENWSFAENELNMLGYQLLARDRIDDAIAIFELNVEAYPDGFNTYDSLGEALMTAGRNDDAISNYRHSLELNPDNTNAVAMLARLQED